MMTKDKDYPPKSGILPQYAHLKGMQENMPVIRQLLGMPKYGNIPTDTALGRALQRFVENDSKDVVCESGNDKHPTIKPRG